MVYISRLCCLSNFYKVFFVRTSVIDLELESLSFNVREYLS